jgi:heme-degrading monooxygenase HmoA
VSRFVKTIVTRFVATLCCLVWLPLSAAGQSSEFTSQSRSFGPRPGEPWENSLGMKFVPVPGTNVLFSIWETRVRDFEAFVQATGYNAGERWRAPADLGQSDVAPGFSQTPLHPVVHVSWNDAVAFCRWLTEKERAAGHPSAGQEFRLPTDTEWSRAVGLPAESGATPQDRDRKMRDVHPWGAGLLHRREAETTQAKGTVDQQRSTAMPTVLNTRPRWAATPPIGSESMTWEGMSGSGAAIGMTAREESA